MIDIHDYYEENEVYFVDFDEETKFPISQATLLKHSAQIQESCPINYLRDNTLEVIKDFLNSIS
jgi:mevalonate pyrophosphate decarboxylase